MKVLILAGGYGTRLNEETEIRPKPMVDIGGKPILWHIMKLYSHYNFNEFIILLGYKGYYIKEYFANYFMHQSDVTIDLQNNNVEIHKTKAEPWKITLIDTGLNTFTGGRIKRVQKFIENETFMLTYGDGVGDINISELLQFHKKNGKYATITAVKPQGRFGSLSLGDQDKVLAFQEKTDAQNAWINGGFFVLEPEIFDYIQEDNIPWEEKPLENLAKDNQIIAYKHYGFWKPMDTPRDKTEMEKLWNSGNPPWKIWKE
jgi:glucose-1-phosphate cytidylyltransferase